MIKWIYIANSRELSIVNQYHTRVFLKVDSHYTERQSHVTVTSNQTVDPFSVLSVVCVRLTRSSVFLVDHLLLLPVCLNAKILWKIYSYDWINFRQGRRELLSIYTNIWIRIIFSKRKLVEDYHTLFKDLKDGEISFYSYFSMAQDQYVIENHIQNQNSTFQGAMSTKQKLIARR